VRCIGGAGIKHGPDGMQIALDNRQSRIGGDEPGLQVRYYHSHRDPDPVYTLFDGVADADLGFSPALEQPSPTTTVMEVGFCDRAFLRRRILHVFRRPQFTNLGFRQSSALDLAPELRFGERLRKPGEIEFHARSYLCVSGCDDDRYLRPTLPN